MVVFFYFLPSWVLNKNALFVNILDFTKRQLGLNFTMVIKFNEYTHLKILP